jgi:hypothetical protein
MMMMMMITKLTEYAESTEDPLIQIVRTHQNNTKSAMVQTARSLRTELQRGTRQTKDSIAEKTKERWRGKRIHGQFPRSLDEKLVDNEQSYRWSKFGNIEEKRKVQWWQHKSKQLLQTISKIKF